MQTETKKTVHQKRAELKALSAPFKVMVKNGAISCINEGLVNFYATEGHTTLKSYRKWKEEGFAVKKGSKALLLWAEPKKFDKTKTEEQKEGEESSFFPIAYVFSNLQVEAIVASHLKQ